MEAAKRQERSIEAIRAQGVVELPPEDHREAASIDAVAYGCGYLVDGMHVAPNRVQIIQGRTTPDAAPDAVKTVRDVPWSRLIWCGIASRRPTRSKPLWVCVMDTFGLGSTFAHQLCREHGFDPEATSKQNRFLDAHARSAGGEDGNR
jgi:hypothetical protein